jgi:hypothetical protein
MPTPTYTPLATVTLGSSAASVTFSSIPATYRDLILVATVEHATAVLNVTFNSDTGSNYSRVFAYGTGASVASFSQTNTSFVLSTGTADFLPQILEIMDYSATDKHKTALLKQNDYGTAAMGAFRWANTAAITTMSCSAGAGTFVSGSTFNLYGVIA